MSSLGFLGFFCFVSRAFLVFAVIFAHCFGAGGFYGLFLQDRFFLGFRVSFVLFHRVFFVCFALISINLRACQGSDFVPGSVCFEPLGSSFVSRAFFFASFLLCFFASLLLLCFAFIS